ncbi:MAG: hypothetical protein E6Q97_19240 [Desulfurellales bacterium]|nr:MAG: hypothetical protein E6Q97_19240 [Desulfurellales bacterium]
MEKIKTKLLVAHSPNCPAYESVRDGIWDNPWFFDFGEDGKLVQQYLDRSGGHRGRTSHWFRLRCNTVDCPALMLVKSVDVFNLVPSHAGARNA